MEHMFIDGYNVINSWHDIFNVEKEKLEDCRDKFLFLISNYQGYKNIKIIIVFDAHKVTGSNEKTETYDNLTVVFTKENETADSYIEKCVYSFRGLHKVKVVTSDYLEQTTILSLGGIRMTPGELKEEIKAACGIEKNIKYNVNTHKRNFIAANINPELVKILEKMRRGI
jgi:uncharacterized protein